MIKEKILEKIKEEEREFIFSDKFAAYDAGRCKLMRFLKKRIYPTDDHTDRLKLVFNVGKIFHDWVEDLCQDFLIARELFIENKYIRGKLDMVLFLERKPVLCEIKTVHSGFFKYKASRHHIYQLTTYSILLKGIDLPIDNGKIIYISKDDLRVAEVDISFKDYEDEVLKDWDDVIEKDINNIPPLPTDEKWECKSCIYRTFCNFVKSL